MRADDKTRLATEWRGSSWKSMFATELFVFKSCWQIIVYSIFFTITVFFFFTVNGSTSLQVHIIWFQISAFHQKSRRCSSTSNRRPVFLNVGFLSFWKQIPCLCKHKDELYSVKGQNQSMVLFRDLSFTAVNHSSNLPIYQCQMIYDSIAGSKWSKSGVSEKHPKSDCKICLLSRSTNNVISPSIMVSVEQSHIPI